MEQKLVGIMGCVLAIAVIAGVAEAQDITAGLVSHWELDETSGITAYDSVGSNNGALVGSPSWVAPGAPGLNPAGAIDFPTAGEIHHVDCGNDASLNLLTGSLTVSAWAQIDSWNGTVSWNRIVSKGGDTGSYDLLRWDKTNAIGFGVYGDTESPFVQGTVDVVSDGLWHLITGVYDRPGGTLSLYIDGMLDNSVTCTIDLPVTQNDKCFYINGRDGEIGPGKRHWDGRVDDVRLYDRALSPTDVQALVPEPATIALLSIGAFGLLRRRRN